MSIDAHHPARTVHIETRLQRLANLTVVTVCGYIAMHTVRELHQWLMVNG